MDSDLHRQQYSHHFQGLQRQFQHPPPTMTASPAGGGLTRYRSAPSSYFSAFLDAATDAAAAEQPRPLSPETESILARLMQNDAAPPSSPPRKLSRIPENSPPVAGPVKQETDQIHNFNSNNTNNLQSSSSQMIYQKPPLMDSNYGLNPSSMDFPISQMRMNTLAGGARNNSNLVRHRSSPAGLFDDIIVENGYLVSREAGSGEFGSGAGDQISFSSGQTQMVPANSDAGGRNMGMKGLDDHDSRRFTGNDEDSFMSSFQGGAWDDSAMFSDQFSGPEMGGGEHDTSDHQVREGKKRPAGLLSHHLSLPQGSLEKLLQFQDSTPCNVRAKRGFATHPRSIAERVRRNKISERMRKLQDLVPNMDKQTNTSDMLDLAVDYIKELQQQFKVLADKQERCTCTN